MFMIPLVALLAAAALLLPMRKANRSCNIKRRLLANGGVFALTAALLVTLAVGVTAEPTPPDIIGGADGPTAIYTTDPVPNNNQGMGYLAAALATGLSCLGAGIAIASTAPAAIGAFSEDPKAFGKALIFVVLGEGVALYGLLISILLINKL